MKSITFGELTIEARTEVIKEAVESTAWSLEKSEKELEFLRARLEEQKKALGHGKWLPWIRETFGQDDAAIQKIQRFLRKPNTSLLTYLPETTVQNNTETQERIPNRVTVVESATEVGQTVVQADDDPPPNPPTNRKVSAGSKKVSEDDKPKTQSVTPVVVCEPELVDSRKAEFEEKTLSDFSFVEILEFIADSSAGDEKTVAKKLRKLADKLDPPTKFVPPDVEEVAEYCAERRATGKTSVNVDAELFVAHYRANGWLLSNGNKMKDWRGSIITWEQREKQNGQNNRRGTALTGADW